MGKITLWGKAKKTPLSPCKRPRRTGLPGVENMTLFRCQEEAPRTERSYWKGPQTLTLNAELDLQWWLWQPGSFIAREQPVCLLTLWKATQVNTEFVLIKDYCDTFLILFCPSLSFRLPSRCFFCWNQHDQNLILWRSIIMLVSSDIDN